MSTKVVHFNKTIMPVFSGSRVAHEWLTVANYGLKSMPYLFCSLSARAETRHNFLPPPPCKHIYCPPYSQAGWLGWLNGERSAPREQSLLRSKLTSGAAPVRAVSVATALLSVIVLLAFGTFQGFVRLVSHLDAFLNSARKADF